MSRPQLQHPLMRPLRRQILTHLHLHLTPASRPGRSANPFSPRPGQVRQHAFGPGPQRLPHVQLVSPDNSRPVAESYNLTQNPFPNKYNQNPDNCVDLCSDDVQQFGWPPSAFVRRNICGWCCLQILSCNRGLRIINKILDETK